MTVFDVIIVLLVVVAFFLLRARSATEGTGRVLVTIGLAVTALFYFADLLAMHVLPLMIGEMEAMAAMRDLHLNLRWPVSLTSLSAIVGGVVVMQTQLRRTLSRLETSSAGLQAVFDAVSGGIITLDETDHIRTINPAGHALLAHDSEVVGAPISQFIPELQTIEPGTNLDVVVDHESRGRYTAVAQISRIDTGGHALTLRDVSHEREVEMALRQSQKLDAVGKLSGGIAHDFNNHLTVILGHLDLLDTDDMPESLALTIAQIREAAVRSSNLTSQLLAFGRQQMLQPKIIDLNDLIARMDVLLRSTLGERIDLDVIRGAGLGRIRADPTQIEQVLVNLVVNARDAIAGSGRVTIESGNVYIDREYARLHPESEIGRYVMMAVSDDGPGMAPEIAERIFEPFFTTKETGTGLGLATVQGVIVQSGGFVNVYSEAGVGTAFKVYLPRVEGDVIAPVQSEVFDTIDIDGSESVLVVEDDAMVRNLVDNILSRHGFRVTTASDANVALAVQDEPDVLLTDVVMPGMNGDQLAAELTQRWPGLQVVFMSGYTENSVVHRGELEAGVTMLQKPFTAHELLTTIRSKLKRRSP